MVQQVIHRAKGGVILIPTNDYDGRISVVRRGGGVEGEGRGEGEMMFF
jgi:hypothetical protein